jgi:hypothetical protein
MSINRKQLEKDINTNINNVEANRLTSILRPLHNQNKKAFSKATHDGIESIILHTNSLSDEELSSLHEKIMDAL